VPAAPLPDNEHDRLKALLELAILDTDPEAALDGLVACAAQATGAPIALVSLIDSKRQWFKARLGLDVAETERDMAFCAHAILSDTPLVVPDSEADPRFSDNPLVSGFPYVKSYLGAPITAPSGERIGTLCAIDRKPHDWTPAEISQIEQLATVVSALLQQRKAMLEASDLAHQVSNLSRNLLFEQSMLEKVANLTGVGTWFFDVDSAELVWSTKAREMHGVDRDFRPTLASALDFFEADARSAFCESIEAVLADGKWFELEMPFAAELGANRWVKVSAKPVYQDGNMIRILGAYQETTKDRKHQQELTSALLAADAASQAKMTFLANMSHEIRTPLNGIIGIADAMQRTNLDGRQREMIDLVSLSGSTLQRLLDDLLDMSKIDAGKLSLETAPLDLAATLQSAADLHRAKAETKGLKLIFESKLPSGSLWQADGVRMRQIMSNLISNAVKFTANGSVTATVSQRATDGKICLEVRDTGIGFDSETAQRLFERFEQADGSTTRTFGGTGLGLSICKALTELMSGTITATSEPGRGSCFTLVLPLESASAAVAPAALEQATDLESDDSAPLRVLLAEDHPVNQRVVSMMLEPLGAVITIAANGMEALAHFTQGGFDIVLMDMAMPEMDGLQATRLIREWEFQHGLARTPIAMLSANAMVQHQQAARDAGCDSHISKPVTAEQLINGISVAMDAVSARSVQAAAA
jgi:two-component system, sensor histidine kinase